MCYSNERICGMSARVTDVRGITHVSGMFLVGMLDRFLAMGIIY